MPQMQPLKSKKKKEQESKEEEDVDDTAVSGFLAWTVELLGELPKTRHIKNLACGKSSLNPTCMVIILWQRKEEVKF